MKIPKNKIFIALGSSIGDADELFFSTEQYLKAHDLEIVQKSKNHTFPPFGGVAQNEFTNAVWEIRIPRLKKFSYDKARKLLNLLHACEEAHGRTRDKKWEDRTLDLDLLIFGDLECSTEKLKIPHPQMQERDFVMIPLREIL